MKLYFIYSGCDGLGEWCEVWKANTAKEAKVQAYKSSISCGFDSFIDVRVKWIRNATRKLVGSIPMGIVTDDYVLREVGVGDDSGRCISCNKSAFGFSQYAICPECLFCAECGHDEDCSEK